MEIILSSNSSKPIYTQITEQIKAQIMDGTLRAGGAENSAFCPPQLVGVGAGSAVRQ